MATKTLQDEVCKLAYDGNFHLLQQKLQKNESLCSQYDTSQRMPLHWAASGGHTEVADYLLKIGAPVDARDESDWTPLMIAVSAGRMEIVTKLISRGALVNAVNRTGQCILHYAASKDHIESDVPLYRNVLLIVKQTGLKDKLNIAELLLNHGADVSVGDKMGSTPLHRAASKGHLQMTKLLLQHEADPNRSDSEGNTPLHLACEEERVRTGKLLVEYGARLDIQNKEKKTPIDLAPPSMQRSLKHSLDR